MESRDTFAPREDHGEADVSKRSSSVPEVSQQISAAQLQSQLHSQERREDVVGKTAGGAKCFSAEHLDDEIPELETEILELEDEPVASDENLEHDDLDFNLVGIACGGSAVGMRGHPSALESCSKAQCPKRRPRDKLITSMESLERSYRELDAGIASLKRAKRYIDNSIPLDENGLPFKFCWHLPGAQRMVADWVDSRAGLFDFDLLDIVETHEAETLKKLIFQGVDEIMEYVSKFHQEIGKPPGLGAEDPEASSDDEGKSDQHFDFRRRLKEKVVDGTILKAQCKNIKKVLKYVLERYVQAKAKGMNLEVFLKELDCSASADWVEDSGMRCICPFGPGDADPGIINEGKWMRIRNGITMDSGSAVFVMPSDWLKMFLLEESAGSK